MKGYYKDPEKTAEVFTPDGFFRTGTWDTGITMEFFTSVDDPRT
jgi:long-subunit acyl-CoA synthetase (AMP-forming)